MSEFRKKGWHPDPYGIHRERYYYLDNQPGRLVRDDGRTEFYDDVPEDAVSSVVHAPPPTPTPPPTPPLPVSPEGAIPAEVTGWVQPTERQEFDAPMSRWLDSKPVPPETDDPIRWRTSVASRWSMPSRKWLLVAGAIVLVIAGVTAFLTLAPSHHHHDPSASSPNIVGTTSTSQTIVVPPDFLNSPPAISKSGSSSTTGWQVADSFTNKSIALAGVSCPTAQECFAVGETTLKTGLILVSTDGGTTWTQRSVPSGVGSLDAIACPSATECIAVGGITAITTLDGGTTWTVQLLGKKSLNGIACPTTSECIAVGESTAPVSGCDSGASFTTLDAGHTWLSTVLPCLVPEGVSCPTAAECELVGTTNNGNQESGQILGSTNRGTRWSVQYTMGGGDTQMLAITCPTTEVCEAVGDAPVQPILRTTTAGATWVPQHLPAPPGLSYFTAVACQTIQLCQAVGSAPPLDTVDGGATWLLSTVSSSISKMTGVTCPSSSSCVAVADGVIPGGVILRLST